MVEDGTLHGAGWNSDMYRKNRFEPAFALQSIPGIAIDDRCPVVRGSNEPAHERFGRHRTSVMSHKYVQIDV